MQEIISRLDAEIARLQLCAESAIYESSRMQWEAEIVGLHFARETVLRFAYTFKP